MTDYMMFEKKPGGIPINEKENALLLGSAIPDVVKLPAELGGKVLRVIGAFVAPCPVTGVKCRHLELENKFYVAESDKFYWYSRKVT